MSDLLIIKPFDTSIKFLNRIISHINRELSGIFDIEYIEIGCHDESHNKTLEVIQNFNKKGLVLFLGHGKSDYFMGSRCEETGIENYSKEEFIHKDHLEVFENKKILALSCNSADLIAKNAVEQGASSFIGFGDIPTDNEIYSIQGMPLPHLTARFKGALVEIFKKSIVYSLKQNLSIEGFYSILSLYINKKIADIIMLHKGLRERRYLADTLFYLKNEIKIYGKSERKLIEK